MGFIDFYWVLLWFPGFYSFKLNFTQFDQLIPSFTGFYRVLLGFILLFALLI